MIVNDWFIVLESNMLTKRGNVLHAFSPTPKTKARGCYKSMFLLAVQPVISQKACFAHKSMKHFSLWCLPENYSLNWLVFNDSPLWPAKRSLYYLGNKRKINPNIKTTFAILKMIKWLNLFIINPFEELFNYLYYLYQNYNLYQNYLYQKYIRLTYNYQIWSFLSKIILEEKILYEIRFKWHLLLNVVLSLTPK